MFPEIDYMKLDGYYYIYLSGNKETELTREQLKQFRNQIHNLLLDLNKELNYEQ